MRLGLSLEALTEDRLVDSILLHGHEVTARPQSPPDLVQACRQGTVEAILLDHVARLLTAEVLAACDAAGVRLVLLARDAEDYRHAASLGIHEVLDATCEWSAIDAVLAGAASQVSSATVPSGGSRGTVVAVWGPAGAPGRSTLAINLAAELADRGLSVALADADSYGASIAALLGLLDEAPGFAAACRMAANDALSPAELDRVSQRYGARRGAFRVLTGISRADRWPELDAERVERVLAECRSWVDVVIVDVACHLESDEEISREIFVPRRNGATLAALASADRVVAVGLADPLGVSRFLRGHAQLLELASRTVHVVMNRLRAGAVGLGAAGQVRSTLARFGRIEHVDFIPDDQRSFDAAVLAGEALRDAAPRSKARAAVAKIATETLGLGLEPKTRRRRRRRLAARKAID